MALTGTHALGDSGRIADDNLRDVSINANAVAIATKTTPADAAAAAAALIVAQAATDSSTYALRAPFSATVANQAGSLSATIGVANRACYQRLAVLGPNTPISAILVSVIGVSSGNICVGVYTSAPGRVNPVSRIATSVSVACPAPGSTTAIALDVPVTLTRDMWFAISADNNTASFGSFVGSSSYVVTDLALGASAYQDTAFPLPATAAPTACRTPGYILVGA